MNDKLKKELRDIVRDNARNKTELSNMVSTMLDEYAESTGNPYIALFYPASAFNNEGQFRNKNQTISPTIAAAITRSAKDRTEIAYTYHIKAMRDATKRGYMVCA